MSNTLKIFSGFLLSWYGIARWILLDKSNDTAQAWLENPLGTFVALVSIVYLVYFIISKTPQKSIFFWIATSMLWAVNCYFLFIMLFEFIKVSSPINFGYVMLDVAILSYYSLEIVFCLMTKNNTNVESNAIISYV